MTDTNALPPDNKARVMPWAVFSVLQVNSGAKTKPTQTRAFLVLTTEERKGCTVILMMVELTLTYLSEFATPGTLESLLDLAICVGMLKTPTGSMSNREQMLTKATGILCPSLYIHKLWGAVRLSYIGFIIHPGLLSCARDAIVLYRQFLCP